MFIIFSMLNILSDCICQFFLHRLLSTMQHRVGPILFQLPPSLPKDVDKLLKVYKLIPKGIKVAFEFRNKSWYCAEVYETMRRCNFGLCDNVSPDDSKFRVSGEEDAVTAQTWHYIRCHKRRNQQITNYTNEQLSNIAGQLMKRRNQNIVQYCFFLNDHEGNGPRNAQTLMNLMQVSPGNFVHDWKPDPVTPSISSFISKINISTTSARKNPSSSQMKKKSRSIDSFFEPSSSFNTSTTQHQSTKRLKTNISSSEKSNQTKKGSIASYFGKKK